MSGIENSRLTLLSSLSLELISSSDIEGVALSPASVRSSIARRLGIEAEGLLATDHYVDGLVDVMMDAIRKCREPLTSERFFNWHAALFPSGRSGMYPITVAEWRRGEEPMQVVRGAFGHEKVHYEAPPSQSVPEMMRQLIDWANTSDSLSPFLTSAVLHFWFVTIHPFDDGNGRISRTLSDMMLARLDEKPARYYSISAEINRNKKAYYNMLEKAQKGSLEITEWIEWYLNLTETAIKIALEGIERTIEKGAYWDKFRHEDVNERQRKVINRLWDGFDGKLTTSKWAKICHCSQDTALRDISDLLAKGMLVKSSEGGRSSNYLLPEAASFTSQH